MSRVSEDLDSLLWRYYTEASQGLVDVSPSRLTRGQGTEKGFYIFKVDLANSTKSLLLSRRATYLKLAHTFLSTVDEITYESGADNNQTEYVGDGLIAYFPESTQISKILTAAVMCREAVLRLKKLDATLGNLDLNFRIVIHYDTLVMAKIGRRGESIISAIGLPIHKVCKIEETINPGVGRVTKEFYQRVSRELRQYFLEVSESKQVACAPIYAPAPVRTSTLANLLYASTEGFYTPPAITYKLEKTILGYNLNWFKLKQTLGL